MVFTQLTILTGRRVVKIEAVLEALQVTVPRSAKMKSKKSIGITAIRVILCSGSSNLAVGGREKYRNERANGCLSTTHEKKKRARVECLCATVRKENHS